MSDTQERPFSLGYLALRGRCPRCGVGSLYQSFLTIASCCSQCNLSFKEHEQGDGAAFFCICIIGSLVAIFATLVEIFFEPPYWLHALIWLPMILGSSLLGIRATKAALIAMQYKFRPEDFKDA